MVINKILPSRAFAVSLVMGRVLLVILLVVFFRGIERSCWKNGGYNRAGEAAALLQRQFGRFGFLALLLRMIKNSGSV
ncbi:hypothetical protein D3C77_406410 [compost metagenome]